MSFEIIFLHNKAENNRVNKAGVNGWHINSSTGNILDGGQTLTGTLRGNCSITNPVIEIDSRNLQIKDFYYNYCNIPNFSRYYFIDDIEIDYNGLITIYLRCDVLMTFRNKILKLKCFVARNEFEYDFEFIDDKAIIKNGYRIYTHPLNNYGYKPFFHNPFDIYEGSDQPNNGCVVITAALLQFSSNGEFKNE